jgi:1-acyl-sn-glycerol-3-phosphate acyltransferase
MKKVRRFIRVSMVISAFMGFWGGAVIFAWTVMPLVWLFGGRNDKSRILTCQRVIKRAFLIFHGYMRALTLLDARVSGVIPRRPNGGPVVMVVNHTTLVDVTAIMSHFPTVVTMAKASIADNFLVGRVLKMCGHVSTGRDGTARATAMVRMAERLKQGFDVLIFPEGTRSPPGGLNPFHRGAFEIACRADVPLVLLRSRCEPSALTKDRAFWNQPDEVAVLTIEPWKVLEPRDFESNSRALKAHAEQAYNQDLGLTFAQEEFVTHDDVDGTRAAN